MEYPYHIEYRRRRVADILEIGRKDIGVVVGGKEQIYDAFHESAGHPQPHGDGGQEKPAPDGRGLPPPVQHHDEQRMPDQIGRLHDEVDDAKSLHGLSPSIMRYLFFCADCCLETGTSSHAELGS